MRVLVTDSIIIEIVQDSLLYHRFKVRVVFGGDLLVESNSSFELKVVLEKTVGGSLIGFDLTSENPILFADDFVFECFYLFLKFCFFFCSLRLFCFVLDLNFSKVVELVIDDIFFLVFLFFLVFIGFSFWFGSHLFLFFFKLPLFLWITLILVRLQLLLVYLLTVQTHVSFQLFVLSIHLQFILVLLLLNRSIFVLFLFIHLIFYSLLSLTFITSPIILFLFLFFWKLLILLGQTRDKWLFFLLVLL